MSKAFKRIPANVLEDALDADNIPSVLMEALREAIKNARENDEMDGEAPIQIFITEDEFDESEEEE